MSELIPVRQMDPSHPSDKIYVRDTEGLYQRIRAFSLWALMGLYFGAVWINVNGQQIVHFDLPARQFHLFGATFWPQDFFLLSLMLLICAFGLCFITSLVGRVWCGYTCPQTAWTFVFMWLEEKVEGSRNQRIKLDRRGPTLNRLRKKSLKHGLWLLVALGTGVTFIGYFYPIRELVPDLATFSMSNGWAGFFIGFFTLATYLNAGWMREKVCLHMCPYARFQSAMFDEDTFTVCYDGPRGEPRGPRKKNSDQRTQGLGDCVDCGICVQVCPTGIDIRQGLQYECINCGLCVDACNQVMDRMDYPRGLIRYTSANALNGLASGWLRPRVLIYGASLILMATLVVVLASTRPALYLEVMRDRGGLYQTGPGELIENTYNLKLTNRSPQRETFDLRVAGPEGTRLLQSLQVTLDSGQNRTVPAVVQIPASKISASRSDLTFTASSQDNPALGISTDSTFFGPAPRPGSPSRNAP
ncbi:MAG: cytochrome c oxidase accessory protein CcoG [Halomonadaceae bacterium]|nr:MAG: cytochrome c oxidase accessory protein CcoG [Halomonadaceae bacterium]